MEQQISLAVDAVVFGYQEEILKVLLIKQKYGTYKNKWSLPGGFVLNGEGLTQAVERELKEEAGITVDYLEQLYTFGDDVQRDKRKQVVSVAYLALVNPSHLELRADTDAADAQWFDLNELETMPYDHADIIKKGKERLQAKLTYQPIGFDLLKKEFPFSDLEKLYQTILEQSIDRRNFRKKILSFDILVQTNKKQSIGSGRPATLFKFNEKKYRELQAKGIHFDIQLA